MVTTNNKHRDALEAGAKLLWYEVVSVIGQGGFGITYLARDTNLDQPVAIKEYLPTEFAHRQENSTVEPLSGEHGDLYRWGLDRFLKEAKTLAQFKHPNIVRVLSVFELHNSAYMVMEYERGEELGARFKRGELRSEQELLRTLLPVMDGLQLVHQAGFIHRDIKPSNIYIREDDSAVLLDFGSARQAIGHQTRALTSLVTGGYAPFEQYHDEGGRQGPWSDIYALGATLYKAVTDKLPVEALVRGTAVINGEADPYVRAAGLGAGRYSAEFLEAVDCALRFREKDRPQSIEEWIPMLSGDAEVPPERAEPTGPSQDQKTFVETVRMNRPPRRVRSGRTDGGEALDSDRVDSAPPGRRPAEPPGSPAEGFPATAVATPKPREQPPPAQGSGSRTLVMGALAGAVLLVVGLGAYLLMGEPEPGREQPPPPPAAAVQPRPAPDPIPAPAPAPEPVVGAPAVDHEAAARAARIDVLLAQARDHLASGQLRQPAGANALDSLRQVLEIDPQNSAAREGLAQVLAALAAPVREALRAERLSEAESALATLSGVFPNEPTTLDLRRQLLAMREAALIDRQANLDQQQRERERQARIDRLLRGAEEHFAAGRLVEPAGRNALDGFREVLAVDDANPAARDGIGRVAASLITGAQAAIAGNAFDRASSLIASLRRVETARADADQLARLLAEKRAEQQRLADDAARRAREAQQADERRNALVATLLASAAENFSASRYTRPEDRNAVKDYRAVLEIDPDNPEARRGLLQVTSRYTQLAEEAAERGEFVRAEGLLDTAASIVPGAGVIGEARRRVASIQRTREAERIREEEIRKGRAAQEQARQHQAARPDVDVVGEILQGFISAFESRDLRRLDQVSEMSAQRRDFVNALFREYPRIEIAISNFSLLEAQNLALAELTITDLTNRNGDKVVPGAWKSSRLQIKRTDGIWGKVRW